MSSYANYDSVNKTGDPSSRQWCLSAKVRKSFSQATVGFGTNKYYPYASRYPVKEGDVVIIGNSLPRGYFTIVETATTGKMGVVLEGLPKLTVPKNKATELDMVFTPTVQKKHIEACAEYLALPQNSLSLTNKDLIDRVYPITFMIRKVLAAASIISFPQFSDADTVQKAKEFLLTEQVLTDDCIKLRKPWPDPIDIRLGDIHVKDGQMHKEELATLKEQGLQGLSSTTLVGTKRGWEVIPGLNSYVNKRVYIGAVAVMVRGGFLNLLNAFLSADPPIKDFYEDLLASIGKCGDPMTLAVLQAYTPIR